jgi:hypothetical protein
LKRTVLNLKQNINLTSETRRRKEKERKRQEKSERSEEEEKNGGRRVRKERKKKDRDRGETRSLSRIQRNENNAIEISRRQVGDWKHRRCERDETSRRRGGRRRGDIQKLARVPNEQRGRRRRSNTKNSSEFFSVQFFII